MGLLSIGLFIRGSSRGFLKLMVVAWGLIFQRIPSFGIPFDVNIRVLEMVEIGVLFSTGALS